MAVPLRQPSLASLADRANAEHHAYEATQRAALAHAVAAGEALDAAKREVGHGGWRKWVATNCEFSERTAQRYMRIARNPTAVSHLPNVTAALATLATARPPRTDLQALCARALAMFEEHPPASPDVERLYKERLAETPEWAWTRALTALNEAAASGPAPSPDTPRRLRELADLLEQRTTAAI